MPSPRSILRGLLLCVLGLPLLVGCYTRLTNPKEALNFVDTEGVPFESNVAKAILAPDYNRVLTKRLRGQAPAYLLKPGVKVRLQIYGHDIIEEVSIRPDGKIDLALIGDVKASGRTIEEVKKEISDRYREFFVDPPQVILNTYTGENQLRVNAGDVAVLNPTGRQGVVNLEGDEMLSEVLARVGALHPKSEWNEVAVIRKGRGKAHNERYIIIADVEKLIRYGDIDQDLAMRDGDVVFLPFEKNTILEEVFASFSVLGDLAEDLDTITSYIDFVEGF